MSMHKSIVRLINAVFYAHHGVLQEEHRIGGRYEVDVAMELDILDAAQKDSLAHTVDYERIYRLVEEIVLQNNFYLIACRVLDTYDMVQVVEVTVRKPNPPVGGTCDRAEVYYRTERQTTAVS